MGNRGTLFDTAIGDRPFNLPLTNNYDAAVAPVATNDFSQNYRRGSTWLIKATSTIYVCTDDTVGAAVWELTSSGSVTPGQLVAPAASSPTGAGSAALVKGGAGGATSGNGGASTVSGGDATAGNGNGGDLNLDGGAKNGTGINGAVRLGAASEAVFLNQGAPNAQTVSATLTAAALLAGIITVAQGASGASALQLPLATAMDTALPTSVAGDAIDFSVVNTSVTSGEVASVTTNTGWTLVGEMTLAITTSARFRARKTGAGAWSLYRLS